MIKIYEKEEWFPTVSHESDTYGTRIGFQKFLRSQGLILEEHYFLIIDFEKIP